MQRKCSEFFRSVHTLNFMAELWLHTHSHLHTPIEHRLTRKNDKTVTTWLLLCTGDTSKWDSKRERERQRGELKGTKRGAECSQNGKKHLAPQQLVIKDIALWQAQVKALPDATLWATQIHENERERDREHLRLYMRYINESRVR